MPLQHPKKSSIVSYLSYVQATNFPLDMINNDYVYLEVYLFEKNEKGPAYLMSFPKRFGIKHMEASSQRLLIKPTNDMAMPAELLMASLFKSKFSYF
jgi:hypothetical protein